MGFSTSEMQILIPAAPPPLNMNHDSAVDTPPKMCTLIFPVQSRHSQGKAQVLKSRCPQAPLNAFRIGPNPGKDGSQLISFSCSGMGGWVGQHSAFPSVPQAQDWRVLLCLPGSPSPASLLFPRTMRASQGANNAHGLARAHLIPSSGAGSPHCLA